MAETPSSHSDESDQNDRFEGYKAWLQINRPRLARKRSFDFVAVILSLPVTVPLGLLVGALVRFELGKPVFFRQERPGRFGRPFIMYKFRTMTDDRDDAGELLSDSHRLTKFGKCLRKSSLDELPGLINVVLGEMSLVGPRPLLLKYEDFYTSEEKRRSWVLPGVTGLAQSRGRNVVEWDDRLAYDVSYVANLSLRQDLSILLCTLRNLVNADDVVPDPGALMLDLDEERNGWRR